MYEERMPSTIKCLSCHSIMIGKEYNNKNDSYVVYYCSNCSRQERHENKRLDIVLSNN